MKYIMFEDFSGAPIPVIFPNRIDHLEMREQMPYTKVLSAGYISHGPEGFRCHGSSKPLEAHASSGDAAIIAEKFKDVESQAKAVGTLMRVTFAGVGEAFDETLANTSLLVESEGSSLLLDCGFTAPSAFWSLASRPLDLDGVFISHFHGDHYFGLPALLVRSVEEGRTRRLTILGQPGVEKRVTTLMEMAYANALGKALFQLYFVECVPGQETHLGDFRLNFAMGDHPMPCLAVRLDCGSASLFYSGDGRPTNATRQLATGCGLAVHESFSLDSTTPGHGTVDSSLEFARETGVAALALVHVKRQVRREMKQTILARTQNADHCRAWLPEPGESFTL